MDYGLLFEALAKGLHELKRGVYACFGDAAEKAWDDDAEEEKDKTRLRLRFFAENPDAPVDSLHVQWRTQKMREGWDYGVKKDEGAKLHPCMTEFSAIPHEQRAVAYIAKEAGRMLAAFAPPSEEKEAQP
jgi:hypothetical protein